MDWNVVGTIAGVISAIFGGFLLLIDYLRGKPEFIASCKPYIADIDEYVCFDICVYNKTMDRIFVYKIKSPSVSFKYVGSTQEFENYWYRECHQFNPQDFLQSVDIWEEYLPATICQDFSKQSSFSIVVPASQLNESRKLKVLYKKSNLPIPRRCSIALNIDAKENK